MFKSGQVIVPYVALLEPKKNKRKKIQKKKNHEDSKKKHEQQQSEGDSEKSSESTSDSDSEATSTSPYRVRTEVTIGGHERKLFWNGTRVRAAACFANTLTPLQDTSGSLVMEVVGGYDAPRADQRVADIDLRRLGWPQATKKGAFNAVLVHPDLQTEEAYVVLQAVADIYDGDEIFLYYPLDCSDCHRTRQSDMTTTYEAWVSNHPDLVSIPPKQALLEWPVLQNGHVPVPFCHFIPLFVRYYGTSVPWDWMWAKEALGQWRGENWWNETDTAFFCLIADLVDRLGGLSPKVNSKVDAGFRAYFQEKTADKRTFQDYKALVSILLEEGSRIRRSFPQKLASTRDGTRKLVVDADQLTGLRFLEWINVNDSRNNTTLNSCSQSNNLRFHCTEPGWKGLVSAASFFGAAAAARTEQSQLSMYEKGCKEHPIDSKYRHGHGLRLVCHASEIKEAPAIVDTLFPAVNKELLGILRKLLPPMVASVAACQCNVDRKHLTLRNYVFLSHVVGNRAGFFRAVSGQPEQAGRDELDTHVHFGPATLFQSQQIASRMPRVLADRGL